MTAYNLIIYNVMRSQCKENIAVSFLLVLEQYVFFTLYSKTAN